MRGPARRVVRVVAAPLEVGSIFPAGLPLLLSLGGLRVVERLGEHT